MTSARFQLRMRSQVGARQSTPPLAWRRWTAIACILLLSLAATIQVAHSHADTRAAEHCQICFAIHSALPAEAVATQVVFTRTQEPPAELIHAVRPRIWISPFANGPPALSLA